MEETYKAAMMAVDHDGGQLVGRIELHDVPREELGSDEVRVAPERVGVCASEAVRLTGATGREYPLHRIGHEISGRVVEIGSAVDRVRLGDFVVAQGEGGLAEYVVLDQRQCVGWPDELVTYGGLAEPLSGAIGSAKFADFGADVDVLVVGSGFMGAATQLLVGRCARSMTVAARRDDALERARRLGATHVIDLREHQPAGSSEADVASFAEHYRDLVGGGAHVAFEVTGEQAGLDLSVWALRRRGRLVVEGYHQSGGGARSFPEDRMNEEALHTLQAHFPKDEGEERYNRTINEGLREAAELLAHGWLDLSGLPVTEFGLSEVERAIRATADREPGFLKAVVRV